MKSKVISFESQEREINRLNALIGAMASLGIERIEEFKEKEREVEELKQANAEWVSLHEDWQKQMMELIVEVQKIKDITNYGAANDHERKIYDMCEKIINKYNEPQVSN